jgi:plastocyanin
VTFNVTASLLAFSTSQLSARTGATVTVNFRNEDAAVTHDLSFGVAGLGHGHTCAGPCSDSYSFTAPAPGTYDFFCTVHFGMAGTFTVTP